MTATAAASSPRDLGTLLGARGPSIAWGRVLAFFLAWTLCSVPGLLFFMVWSSGSIAASYWISQFVGSLLLTLLVIVCFRNIREDFGAGLVAAIAYAVLLPAARLLSQPRALWGSAANPSIVAMSFFGPFFVLLALALTVRHIRPRWLALWIGALAGFLASYASSGLPSMLLLLRRGAPGLHFSLRAEGLASSLVTATLFTLIFEGVSGALP